MQARKWLPASGALHSCAEPVLVQFSSSNVPVMSIVLILFQYCSRTTPVLLHHRFQHCPSIVPVLLLYSTTVSVLFQYCPCTAAVLLQYYFRAVPILQCCSSSAPVQYYTSCCTSNVPVMLQYCCSCEAQEEVCWVRCSIL